MPVKPIVFLDRDGTINVDHGYVVRPEDIALLEGAADAIASLRREGFLVVVVSNQSAVGRGMAEASDVDACNAELCRLLLSEDADAELDLILYSTDHPDTAGPRRKPGIGLLDEIPWEFDAERAWIVGDKQSDVEFGLNAGLPAEHCLRLNEEDQIPNESSSFPSLAAAAAYITLKNREF